MVKLFIDFVSLIGVAGALILGVLLFVKNRQKTEKISSQLILNFKQIEAEKSRSRTRKCRPSAISLAAITLPWSNGQVEAQITKLKLVKRQMYGRAKLDLLPAKLIGAL